MICMQTIEEYSVMVMYFLNCISLNFFWPYYWSNQNMQKKKNLPYLVVLSCWLLKLVANFLMEFFYVQLSLDCEFICDETILFWKGALIVHIFQSLLMLGKWWVLVLNFQNGGDTFMISAILLKFMF